MMVYIDDKRYALFLLFQNNKAAEMTLFLVSADNFRHYLDVVKMSLLSQICFGGFVRFPLISHSEKAPKQLHHISRGKQREHYKAAILLLWVNNALI